MCLVCLSQSWVTDVPALISTHEFFHLLLLLSKSEKATGGLGPLPQGGLSCAISGCRVLLGLLFCRSVLMKHLCDQGKEVRTLWSYTEDGKEADWMFSWIQGSTSSWRRHRQSLLIGLESREWVHSCVQEAKQRCHGWSRGPWQNSNTKNLHHISDEMLH